MFGAKQQRMQLSPAIVEACLFDVDELNLGSIGSMPLVMNLRSGCASSIAEVDRCRGGFGVGIQRAERKGYLTGLHKERKGKRKGRGFGRLSVLQVCRGKCYGAVAQRKLLLIIVGIYGGGLKCNFSGNVFRGTKVVLGVRSADKTRSK